MSRHRVFIDSFSEGLDELPQGVARNLIAVLSVMAHNERKRFSIFEVTANQKIASTVTTLVSFGYIETDISCGFPWTEYKITKSGHEALANHPSLKI